MVPREGEPPADGGSGKVNRCTPAKGCVRLEYGDAAMARMGEEFRCSREVGVRENTQQVSPIS